VTAILAALGAVIALREGKLGGDRPAVRPEDERE
jgi:hypothetical protein